MAAVKQEVAPERKQATPKAPRVKREKREEAAEEGGARRSTRLRGAAAKKEREEEAEEARLERELGEFIVDGECPRCGKVFERGHRAHLAACTGVRPKPERAPRPPKIEVRRGCGGLGRQALLGSESEQAGGRAWPLQIEARHIPCSTPTANSPPLPQGLSAEDAKDKKKVLAARMQQLALSGLVDFNSEAARWAGRGAGGGWHYRCPRLLQLRTRTGRGSSALPLLYSPLQDCRGADLGPTCPSCRFVVIGSRGNHYTVRLQDGLHSCECMDWRFRRHHCKHICLVLSQLGILEEPTHWREGVERSLSELVQQRRERRAAEPPEAEPPLGKEAQMALRFLD